MNRVWLAIVLISTLGCDSPGDPDLADASAAQDAQRPDAPPADASLPDALTTPDADTRAATLLDCGYIIAVGMGGYTAEVTDWGGYIPTADGEMPVGYFARWVYADGGGGVWHTITSGTGGASPAPDGLFATEPFDQHGDQTCVRFDAPGIYPYHCAEHPMDEQGTFTISAD